MSPVTITVRLHAAKLGQGSLLPGHGTNPLEVTGASLTLGQEISSMHAYAQSLLRADPFPNGAAQALHFNSKTRMFSHTRPYGFHEAFGFQVKTYATFADRVF